MHGDSPQLSRLLDEAGVEPWFEDGIRLTAAKTLGVARKLFLEEYLRLVNRLDELGIATRSLSGVSMADYLDMCFMLSFALSNHVARTLKTDQTAAFNGTGRNDLAGYQPVRVATLH